MAMIKCPECGRDISDKALKCPQCGYPMQEMAKTAAAGTVGEGNGDSFGSKAKMKMKELPKKKIAMIAAGVCVAVAAVVGISIGVRASASNVKVDDISLEKWKMTDSSEYSDTYEGTVSSSQKKPFVAVIAEYDKEDRMPNFVYVEDGKGTLEVEASDDEDPSIQYRPIGYIGGTSVGASDVDAKYSEGEYHDASSGNSSWCTVTIDIDMHNNKSGLLVFEVENETGGKTDTNLITAVVDGKAEYNYDAELPYKSRGVDISIVPKFFCNSEKITKESYTVEKEYTIKKSESGESCSGEQTLAFEGYHDGIVLYTEKLLDGGDKEYRNKVRRWYDFLHDEECTISTYDSVGEDEKLLTPKYQFCYAGYIEWKDLEDG